MTAKDNAQELIGRFLTGIEFDVQSQSCMDWTSAKQCALICVDEIIETIRVKEMEDDVEYWLEVQMEIEKM